MDNIEIQMDSVAEIIADFFNINNFEMVSVKGGNLNYSYKLKTEKREFFLKLFSNRMENQKRKYRDVNKRYEMEKYVLSICNEAGLLVPRLEGSIDKYNILVLQSIEDECLAQSLTENEDFESILYALGIWLGSFHNVFEKQNYKNNLCSEFSFMDKIHKSNYENYVLENNLIIDLIDKLNYIKFSKRVWSRNDCHFGNFIVSNSHLYGIDFELCSYQAPLIDLAGLFVSYIELRKRIVSNLNKDTSYFEQYCSLLEGYKEGTNENYDPEFHFYIAAILLKKYLKSRKTKYMNYLIELNHFFPWN